MKTGKRHDGARPGRDHRRRRRGVQRALSSGEARLDRLPAAGARRADLGLDLACRGELPELLHQLERHQAAAPFDQALCASSARRPAIPSTITSPARSASPTHATAWTSTSMSPAMAQAQGIEFELLSPAEAKARHPFLELHDLQGALWDPYDGDIDPSQLTQAYAKGAKDLGCRIQRFTRVTALQRRSPTAAGASPPTRARSRRRSWSMPRAIAPARSWPWSGNTCPSSPWRINIS